jgi:hypothetical protein
MASADEPPVPSLDALPDAAVVLIVHALAGMPVLRHAGRYITKGRSGRLNVVAAVRDVCALAQTAKRYRRLAAEADECAPALAASMLPKQPVARGRRVLQRARCCCTRR